jgi:cytochrome c oxidase cbb3-type subunit 3
MNRTRYLVLLFWLVFASFGIASCKREKRQFRQAPPAVRSNALTVSDLRPGESLQIIPTRNSSEDSAYDVSEGKRLFEWYNCSGCHSHGGGGMGPPLIDDKWIYGSDPSNVFATIVEGRPNGMPSFRNKIPDAQVWQLVAFVRSMSGQLSKGVSSGRSDEMNAHKSEQRTPDQQPKNSGLPPSAELP